MILTRTDISIFVFGCYSQIMGLILLFFPNLILPLFNIPASNESWLYLLGFVLMCSSYYYIRSALSNNRDFALYTIHTRFLAPLVVVFLIVTGKADWHILSFGIIDGLGALWTFIELKKNNNLQSTYE